MSEHICRNCRWWAGDTIHAPKDWAGCELADSDNGRKHKHSLAKAMDAEMYHAVLQTAPDFGCVQWEGKE